MQLSQLLVCIGDVFFKVVNSLLSHCFRGFDIFIVMQYTKCLSLVSHLIEKEKAGRFSFVVIMLSRSISSSICSGLVCIV